MLHLACWRTRGSHAEPAFVLAARRPRGSKPEEGKKATGGTKKKEVIKKIYQFSQELATRRRGAHIFLDAQYASLVD